MQFANNKCPTVVLQYDPMNLLPLKNHKPTIFKKVGAPFKKIKHIKKGLSLLKKSSKISIKKLAASSKKFSGSYGMYLYYYDGTSKCTL